MNRLITLITSFMLALMACGCVHDDDYRDADIVKVGQMLPDFTVAMNDGSVVTGEMLRECVAVVVFFDTSCSDCQQLLPQLQMLYDDYSEKAYFVLISRAEGEEMISSFWALHNLTMPYSAQSDRGVYNLFARSLVPRVYISDAEGVVRYIFADNPVPSYEVVRDALLGVM
jgi:peroxiredoxin